MPSLFIPTPVITVNIVTAGGFKTPAYVEIYGPPKSGKSAFAYATASIFQKQVEGGKVHILDQEMSASQERLKYAFGIDTDPRKLEVFHPDSIEGGFKYIVSNIKECENPKLFIWDSIAASRPKKEVEAAISGEDISNTGGMSLKARVLNECLATTAVIMQDKPVLIIFLNQVRTTGFGTFKGPHSHHSSGGFALKHWVHYCIWMEAVKKEWSEDEFMDVSQESSLSLEKTKFSPCVRNISVKIDEKAGGVIVDDEEIFLTALKLKIIEKSGGWYRLPGIDRSMRWSDLLVTEGAKELCIQLVTEHYRKNYKVLDAVYREKSL